MLTLIRAAIKKSIEWRLQVQIVFLTEVNLAPSRPEQPCKEYELPGRAMLLVGQNFGCFLMKEKHKKIKNFTSVVRVFIYSIIIIKLNFISICSNVVIQQLITIIVTIIILILLYSIGFCHRSKEQRLKVTKKQIIIHKYKLI